MLPHSATSVPLIPDGLAGALWWVAVCLLALGAVLLAISGSLLWLASIGRIHLGNYVRPVQTTLWIGLAVIVCGFVLAAFGERPTGLLAPLSEVVSAAAPVMAILGLVMVMVGVVLVGRENRGYQHRLAHPVTIVAAGIVLFAVAATLGLLA